MAVTTPDDLWSPDDGSEYNIPVDTAAMQDTVQAALTALRASIPSLGAYRTGSNADRIALSGAGLTPGLRFWTTDTLLDWVYDGAKWLIAPGQVLATMEGPTGNTSGNGAIVGSVMSTPVLSVGQRFKIVGSASAFATTPGGLGEYRLNWRNASADVTFAAFTGQQTRRSFSSNASSVGSSLSFSVLGTASVAEKVSAALYTAQPQSSVYGADGTRFWIESA